jgi:hypothetical protein
MSATLMYVGIGAILITLVGTFALAILFLQTARRYVDLTEKRLELLREGEAFLLKIVQRQGRALEENLQREAEQRESVPEMVGYVIGARQAEESEDTRPPESLRPRGARERHRPSPKEEEHKQQEKSGEAASLQENNAPLRGVQVPHPDDDAPGRGWNRSPARFFQKCYDRYLEHYEGYVRLAERLHATRDEAGTEARGRREWEDKLRRAYDAIERTTQRLDVLEEHYPELATDSDRISSRIGTARLHADLTERFGRPH